MLLLLLLFYYNRFFFLYRMLFIFKYGNYKMKRANTFGTFLRNTILERSLVTTQIYPRTVTSKTTPIVNRKKTGIWKKVLWFRYIRTCVKLPSFCCEKTKFSSTALQESSEVQEVLQEIETIEAQLKYEERRGIELKKELEKAKAERYGENLSHMPR